MTKLFFLASSVSFLILITASSTKTKFSLDIPAEHINGDSLQEFQYLMLVRFQYLFSDTETTDKFAAIILNLYDTNARYSELSSKSADDLTPEEQNELYELLIENFGTVVKEVLASSNITLTFEQDNEEV